MIKSKNVSNTTPYQEAWPKPLLSPNDVATIHNNLQEKPKNKLNQENQKNNWKNQTMKKNPIKPIRIFKTIFGSIRFDFDFISLEPKNLNRIGLVKKYKITESKKLN
jgi:hypothetical protein